MQWHLLRKSERRASGSLWKLRLKLRLKLSDLVELILMSFQVIRLLFLHLVCGFRELNCRKCKNCNPQLKLLTTSKSKDRSWIYNFRNSYVSNMSFFIEIEERLKKEHNIILISNHQTEADPAFCISNFEDMDDFNYSLSEVKSKYREATLLLKWIAFQTVIVNELVKKLIMCWWLYLFTRATLVGWLVSMIVGKVANFMAYIYAPAILVTPLGAISIIVSSVLAHFLLNEWLQMMGVLGCLSCIVGSIVIVIHAPQEQTLTSV
ncbi:hypothetical protein HN51_052076 [Arachis hypogaea]